jgi:Tfp pilus assembly protein PilP
MRVHKSIVLMIMFLLILLVLYLSSSRHISFDDKEEIMEERRRRRRRMKLPLPFPQAYEEFKDKRVSGFQIVSHTSTPGGPNPLHN